MSEFPNDPELRELLAEIVVDPGATLLRLRPGEAIAEGREDRPGASRSTPFLRSAERRLLEAHREELGRLLYRYAAAERLRVPAPLDNVHYADFGRTPPVRSDLDRRNRALAPVWTRDLEDLPAVDLLRACLRQSRWVSPTQLTAACLRIAPSPAARIAHALDLARYEQLERPAVRLLHDVLGQNDSGTMASYAWENLAMLEAPNFASMALSYERSVSADAERVVPSIAWLRYSLQLGSLETVLRAAEQVELAVPAKHPALAWFLSLGVSPEQLTRDTARLARVAEDLVGPVAREVIEFALSGPSIGRTGGIPAIAGVRSPISAR